MGIKRVWRAISTGWVVEYLDYKKEPVYVFLKQCLITSRCCASDVALPRAHLKDNPFSCSDQPLILSFIYLSTRQVCIWNNYWKFTSSLCRLLLVRTTSRLETTYEQHLNTTLAHRTPLCCVAYN